MKKRLSMCDGSNGVRQGVRVRTSKCRLGPGSPRVAQPDRMARTEIEYEQKLRACITFFIGILPKASSLNKENARDTYYLPCSNLQLHSSFNLQLHLLISFTGPFGLPTFSGQRH